MKNLTVVLENRPGALAAACDAIGHAGINIEGLVCFASQGIAILYVAVEDGAGARRALSHVGLKVSEEREVAVTDVEDKPGELAHVLRGLGDAGINVELAYLASGPRVIVGADDLDAARSILTLQAAAR
ncbi:MAG TPA: ACT domain-containing protein [Chloroflexota bacterium]|nr:ACT domain-containing protein [Chloroflexota bacterium]